MAAAHRGIDNPQREQRHRGIMLCEFRASQALGLRRLKSCNLFGDHGSDGFLDDQRNQRLGCVIGPGTMAGLIVRPRLDAMRLKVWLDTIFEDGFIDRAQLLHRKIAVVDIAQPPIFAAVRERQDDFGQHGIGQTDARQQRRIPSRRTVRHYRAGCQGCRRPLQSLQKSFQAATNRHGYVQEAFGLRYPAAQFPAAAG